MIFDALNIQVVVRLLNGPLDAAVSNIAGGFAEALKDPTTASLVRMGSDATNDFLLAADNLLDRAVQDIHEIVQRGREERGGDGEDAVPEVFDFTRGLIAQAVTRGNEALRDAHRLHDQAINDAQRLHARVSANAQGFHGQLTGRSQG